MRWTKNDTLASDAIMKMGQGLRDMWGKYQAGNAYTEAMKAYGDGPEAAAARDKVAEVNSPVANREYDAYDMQNQDTIRAANAGTMAGTSQLPTADSTWMREREAQTAGLQKDADVAAAFNTPMKKHTAGLQGQMAYYAARGDTEEAGKLLERISNQETNELTRRGLTQSLKKGEYELGDIEAEHTAGKQYAKFMTNPKELEQHVLDRFGRNEIFSNGVYKDKTAKVMDAEGGKVVSFFNPNGSPATDAKPMFIPQSKWDVEARRVAQGTLLDGLVAANPAKWAKTAHEMGISDETIKLKKDELQIHKDKEAREKTESGFKFNEKGTGTEQVKAAASKSAAGAAWSQAESVKGIREQQVLESAAKIKEMEARTNTWENKLPEDKKIVLTMQKEVAVNAAKAASADPENPKLQASARDAAFKVYSFMKQNGMKDIDPVAMAGIPQPYVVADKLRANKTKPAEVANIVKQARERYGDAYADDIGKEFKSPSPASVVRAGKEQAAANLSPPAVMSGDKALFRSGPGKSVAEQNKMGFGDWLAYTGGAAVDTAGNVLGAVAEAEPVYDIYGRVIKPAVSGYQNYMGGLENSFRSGKTGF